MSSCGVKRASRSRTRRRSRRQISDASVRHVDPRTLKSTPLENLEKSQYDFEHRSTLNIGISDGETGLKKSLSLSNDLKAQQLMDASVLSKPTIALERGRTVSSIRRSDLLSTSLFVLLISESLARPTGPRSPAIVEEYYQERDFVSK